MSRSGPPRIDIHSHVALPHVLEMARAIKVRGSGPGKQDWVAPESSAEHARQARAVAPKLARPRSRLEDMDAMGIDIQVISMNLPTAVYWAAGATGQKVTRACNDGIAEFTSVFPDRFVGLGAAPLQDMGRAVKELDYAMGLGLRGVIIPSNVRNHDLGEARFRPFWARAEEIGAVVCIHPRGFTHDARLRKFFLWNAIGQPLEEALAMASLIHEGVMEDFPRLKVVMSHGGGYLPYYPGRSDKSFDSRPEARANIRQKPSRYMRRFHYDSVVFDRDMLVHLVQRVGAGRVMMGTDYPRGEMGPDPVGFITRTRGISSETKRKIMSGNAARLFSIPL
jgi:aminocarboxymuconate-semialdehyde decarboxylase